MPQEIERKFLVADASWRDAAVSSSRLRQGYLCADPERSVRVRLDGDDATLTIKGASVGPTRDEFEYAIPADDAHALLERLCRGVRIEKTRHRVPHEGLVWEVDVFEGDNEGLVVAEVELERADQRVPLPDWVGDEVTDDARYTNAALSRAPYSSWNDG